MLPFYFFYYQKKFKNIPQPTIYNTQTQVLGIEKQYLAG